MKTMVKIDELLPTDALWDELVQSHITQGILQDLKEGKPIRVPPDVSRISDLPTAANILSTAEQLGFDPTVIKYLIHNGHHRWTAARLAGWTEIVVTVRPPEKADHRVSFSLLEMLRTKTGSK